MFFHDVNDGDFLEVLRALPSPPSMTRAHLLGGFSVIVDSDDPAAWWQALTLDRGEEGAAKAVAQLIINSGGARVVSLIKAEAAGRYVVPRADDSKLTRLLFDGSLEGSLVDQETLKSIVCEYYEETQVVIDDEDDELPDPEDEYGPEDEYDPDAAEDEEDEEDVEGGPSIFDLFSGKPRASAQGGAQWTLERVQHPAKGFSHRSRSLEGEGPGGFPVARMADHRLRLRPTHLPCRQAEEPE